MSNIHIDLSTNATKYCTTFSGIGEILGIIAIDNNTGALVRTKAGVYICVDVGAIHSLPQEIIKEMLKKQSSKIWFLVVAHDFL